MRDSFTENFKNDLAWLITLRAVKVRHSLRNWGYIASARCASCPRVETIDHCFLHCGRVKSVWIHFIPLLSAILTCPFLPTCAYVFFYQFPDPGQKNRRLLLFVLKSILYAIWRFRKKATFIRVRRSPEVSLGLFQETLEIGLKVTGIDLPTYILIHMYLKLLTLLINRSLIGCFNGFVFTLPDANAVHPCSITFELLDTTNE